MLLGLALLLPAGLALLVSHVGPTVHTFVMSFQSRGLADPEWVGTENYRNLLEAQRPSGFGLALSLALIPLVALLATWLLAWAISRAGRPVRLGARLALTLPLVLIAPAAAATAWSLDRRSRFWLTNYPERFVEAPTVVWSLRAVVWVSLFGLVSALGVMLFLAAFRGRGPGRPAWPAVLAVGGLATLAVVAVGLQSLTFPMVITRGNFDTATPMISIYDNTFIMFQFGLGAARAVPLLLILMVLGIAAGLLVTLTRLRVETVSEPRATASDAPGWDGIRVLALLLAIGGVVLILAATLYALWPWLSGLGRTGPIEGGDAASMVVRTWLPPLISTVVGVGLAAVAGFGIGALRPLGRHSELLLLPFAPWLFISIGPLFISKFETLRQLELLDTAVVLIPQVWLVVPALFVFTLLFRGLEGQRRAQASAGSDPGPGSVVVRALPMLLLVGGATWLVQSQSLLWGLFAGSAPDRLTGPVWLFVQQSSFATSIDDIGYALALPIPAIVIFLVGLGLLQVFYLDRLAIRAGSERNADLPTPPA